MQTQIALIVITTDPVVHEFGRHLFGLRVAVAGIVINGHCQVGESLAEDNLFLALQGLGLLVEDLVAVDGANGVPLYGLPSGINESSGAASFSNQTSRSNCQNALSQTT